MLNSTPLNSSSYLHPDARTAGDNLETGSYILIFPLRLVLGCTAAPGPGRGSGPYTQGQTAAAFGVGQGGGDPAGLAVLIRTEAGKVLRADVLPLIKPAEQTTQVV